jgi:ketopantoate reductase
LRPLAERGVAVVSFQNGVQKDDLLRKHIPAESVMGGMLHRRDHRGTGRHPPYRDNAAPSVWRV